MLKNWLIKSKDCKPDTSWKHWITCGIVNTLLLFEITCVKARWCLIGRFSFKLENMVIALRKLNGPNKGKQYDILRMLPAEQLSQLFTHTWSVKSSAAEHNRVNGNHEIQSDWESQSQMIHWVYGFSELFFLVLSVILPEPSGKGNSRWKENTNNVIVVHSLSSNLKWSSKSYDKINAENGILAQTHELQKLWKDFIAPHQEYEWLIVVIAEKRCPRPCNIKSEGTNWQSWSHKSKELIPRHCCFRQANSNDKFIWMLIPQVFSIENSKSNKCQSNDTQYSKEELYTNLLLAFFRPIIDSSHTLTKVYHVRIKKFTCFWIGLW